MELTSTPIPTRTTPETESETSPPTQPIKPTDHHHNPRPLSFTNGVLKRHKNHHHHHPPPPSTTPVVVCYKECLRNHAASLGGHALDGCGEFMPSPTAIPTDPTSLKCAACGCHRNFHRRDPEEGTHIVEFHHPPPPPPPPPPPRSRSPNSASPPPLSSSYYPSAPHMLLALSTGVSGGGAARDDNPAVNANATATTTTMMMSGGNSDRRKRHRTKFSQEQKDKMYLFAERVEWKMQKRDEVVVEEFCNEVGIGKGVLKVWMHNNKNTFAKRDVNTSRDSLDTNNNNNNHHNHHNDHHDNNSSAHVDVATNGSSSSS